MTPCPGSHAARSLIALILRDIVPIQVDPFQTVQDHLIIPDPVMECVGVPLSIRCKVDSLAFA